MPSPKYEDPGARASRFALMKQEILRRRGDRVYAERLQRAVVAHWEATYYGKTLDEVARLSPTDYELYRAVTE